MKGLSSTVLLSTILFLPIARLMDFTFPGRVKITDTSVFSSRETLNEPKQECDIFGNKDHVVFLFRMLNRIGISIDFGRPLPDGVK